MVAEQQLKKFKAWSVWYQLKTPISRTHIQTGLPLFQ